MTIEKAALQARITELEQALRLHLAVSPDDPILVEPVEQEVVRLRLELAQRKGWQQCRTHQAINADHHWGCPDCVRELRTQLKAVKRENSELLANLSLCNGNELAEQLAAAQELVKELEAEIERLNDESL